MVQSLALRMDTSLGSVDREQFPAVLPGGVTARDAHNGLDVVLQVALPRWVEDTRGLHHPLCSKQAPAKVGMCPFCHVQGITRVHTSTVYPSAVTYLPREHTMRADFRREFSSHYQIKSLAAPSSRPRSMTVQRAISDAEAVMIWNESEEDYAFKNVPVLNDPGALGPTFDSITATVADPAHGLSNFTKDMYNLIGNHGAMAMSTTRLARERSKLGRPWSNITVVNR